MKKIIALITTIAFIATLVVLPQTISAQTSTTLFQAEKGTLVKPAIINTTFKGASGKRSVHLKGKNPAVTFNVALPKSTNYTFKVRYSKYGQPSSTIKLYLNGKYKKYFTLASTKSFSNWKDYVFEISLPKGKSKITLKKSTLLGSIAIDYISIVAAPVKQAVDINFYNKYQTIEGLGAFGGKYQWFAGPSDGIYADEEFSNKMVNDLGLTVSRLNIHSDFELANDNNDVNVTDLTKFNVNGFFKSDIQFVNKFIEAGVKKFIATAWSPPAWMKTNNDVENGGELKAEYYEEFAEMLVAYIKIFKRDMGLDLYAISLQNELAFVEPYESCVYTPIQMAKLLNVVGKRFDKENINVKIFGPEDMLGSLNSSMSYLLEMENYNSLKYLDAIAWHGYSDGVNAASLGKELWNSSYELARGWNKQHWMTETSGYNHTWASTIETENNVTSTIPSAFVAANDIFTALKYGKINLWTWWSLSDGVWNKYSLTNRGQAGKKYYISKQYFRYIRPGAVQVGSTSDSSTLKVIAFKHDLEKTATIVLLNTGTTSRTFNISNRGGTLPASFTMYRTSATEDCVDLGAVQRSVTIPAQSIVTLYGNY